MLGIPAVCFLPLPLLPQVISSRTFLRGIPDLFWPLTYLPRRFRKLLVRMIPTLIVFWAAGINARKLIEGAKAAGWTGPPFHRPWDVLVTDPLLVADWKGFYTKERVPESLRITGPVFSSGSNVGIDPEIHRLFAFGQEKARVFCSMGSSGEKKQLIEAIKGFTRDDSEKRWNAVVLVPPAICSLEDAEQEVPQRSRSHVFLTDEFIPAAKVTAMADLVVCHGGRGPFRPP